MHRNPSRKFIIMVVIGSLVTTNLFAVTAVADASTDVTISCQDYQSHLTEEKMKTIAREKAQLIQYQQTESEQKFQSMRAKVLALCHESYFESRMQGFKNWWKYTDRSLNVFSIPGSIVKRVKHWGVSDQIYQILNYPRLPEILRECYPGDGSYQRYERFKFKQDLASEDRQSYLFGTIDGIWAFYLVGELFSKIPWVAKARNAFKLPEKVRNAFTLPKISQLPAVVKRFPFLATEGGQKIVRMSKWVFWSVILGGGLAAWQHVSHEKNWQLNLVPNSDPQPVTQPSTTILINAITASLSKKKIDDLQNFFDQMNASYGRAHAMMVLNEGVQAGPLNPDDLSAQIEPAREDCLSSIQQYRTIPANQNLVGVQTFCGTYIDIIKTYLSNLRYPAIRCLAINRGVIARTQAEFEQILNEIPPGAISATSH